MLDDRNPLVRVLASPVRDEARTLAASCGLAVLRIGTDLARPWPLALGIDYAIDGRDVPAFLVALSPETLLVTAGFATVVVSAASGILSSQTDRLGERAAERIAATLRAESFARSLTLSLRWHQRVRSGELVSRLTSDVGRLLDAVVAVCVLLLPQVVTVVAVLALLLLVDPGLATLGLVVIPVLGAVALRQRRAVRSTQTTAREAAGRLTGTAADLVRNVAAIQAFGRLDAATGVFDPRNAAVLHAQVRAVDTEARWAPRHGMVLAVGTGLVLVVGGLQVRQGMQTTGHLLVVLAYLAELYSPVRGLTRLSVVLAKARVSAERVAEVLDASDAVADRPAARDLPARVSGISFRRVRFGYEPTRPVLDGFDLDVRQGETVCLFGPSGVGKSTALALVLRLWDADAGRVLVDGIDVREVRLDSLRSRLAYVPQDPWLLDATLAQNIAFGSRSATRAGVEAAARTAGVAEFADHLPLGYDTELGEGGVTLSGGQRRRVALARALVSSASVLLLDEPTASLDSRSAATVTDAIRATSLGRTTLLVTHDPTLADIADRVVVLEPRLTTTAVVGAAVPHALGRR